jgi:Leucine-rich repeat (LRR) protein
VYGNGIEDLSPLLALPELKFVSVTGNPVRSMEVISELIEREVTVVWF